MISQFYVLSPRGDTIINRDFRGDVVKGTAEIFFRKVKFWTGDAPPIFNLDGISYIFIKKNGLYFVATTMQNVSPAYVIELLQRLAKVFKDFCGVLNEESIRKNFVLVYEVLDEMLDFGYPQLTSTEQLKSCVHNEAILVDQPPKAAGIAASIGITNFQLNPKTVPSVAVHRPVGVAVNDSKNRKNEIFVDILERLTVVLNPSGYILNSCIDGSIQMKSYLSGSPELKLALNENLVIGKESGFGGHHGGYGVVVLDDCNFHQAVDLREFEQLRMLSFYPPDGEFVVMNYRITSEFRAPFRIFPVIEQSGPQKVDYTLMVRADIPEANFGANVVASCTLPKHATSVTTELMPAAAAQTAEFMQSTSKVVWNIKKFQGGAEHSLRCRITLSQPCTANIKKEFGPVSLTFEIPMYNVSNVQVRYLRISDVNKCYNPYRWVRYVTQSCSYICRM